MPDQASPALARLRWPVLLAAFTACLLLLAVLGIDVLRKIDLQGTARSDNVQWTLSQLEIEFLRYSSAVDVAVASDIPDFEALRLSYDLFYSRLGTVSHGAVFAILRDLPEFHDLLVETQELLDSELPLIDAADATLLAGLAGLQADVRTLGQNVRRLSLIGIETFARLADRQREAVGATLTRVTIVAAALILSLIGLSIWLARLWRVANDRATALRIASARSEAMLDCSLDAVIAIDEEGRIISFNGAAEDVFGYTAATVTGRHMADMIIPPHLRAAHDAGMERFRRTGETRLTDSGRAQLDAMRADGSIFPAEMSIGQTHEGGKPFFVSFLRDITSRVEVECDLRRARDEALAAARAKADLLAVMSHEMRTPLNGLIGSMELLADSGLGPRQRELLRMMQTSGRILQTHVNDVLDIARIDSGKVTIQHEPVDMSALVAEVVESLRAVAQENGNRIEVTVDPAVPALVDSDPVRLQQILLNLVGNAVKFTRDGEIRVEIAVDDSPGHMLIRVTDTGIGMTREDLSRVFEDFAMVDSSYSRKAGGTGLGLGIVRRVVALMEGEIGAESEPGEGSRFWARLPMTAASAAMTDGTTAPRAPLVAAAATSAAPTDPVTAPAGAEILVVEDNEINRFVVTGLLERLGHRVTLAGDGEEGVARAQDRRFDTILMDISMPRMDGVTAARTIRTGRGANRDTPIIALTAHALPEDIARFHAAGMQQVLTKPLTHAMLLGALSGLRPQQTSAEADEPLVDTDTLHDFAEDLGAQTAMGLLRRFIDETAVELAPLLDPAQSLPAKEILPRVHKVAGAAGLFGARRLAAALRRAETQGKTGDEPGLRQSLRELGPIWAQTRAALAAEIDNAAVESAGSD